MIFEHDNGFHNKSKNHEMGLIPSTRKLMERPSAYVNHRVKPGAESYAGTRAEVMARGLKVVR